MNLLLKTWGHEIAPLDPDSDIRCTGVQPKKGEPRCSARAVYRAWACYVTGPRGRHGRRSMNYCPECVTKWARWMEIDPPVVKMDEIETEDLTVTVNGEEAPF